MDANSPDNAVPTARPVITTYLSSDFYKACLQWLAEKDDRSMAWLVARWVEGKLDEAIENGEIPADVVANLQAEHGETK
jgi:hypothetical protein